MVGGAFCLAVFFEGQRAFPLQKLERVLSQIRSLRRSRATREHQPDSSFANKKEPASKFFEQQ